MLAQQIYNYSTNYIELLLKKERPLTEETSCLTCDKDPKNYFYDIYYAPAVSDTYEANPMYASLAAKRSLRLAAVLVFTRSTPTDSICAPRMTPFGHLYQSSIELGEILKL